MPVMHEPWLVVLSLIVAIQGAYVGLSLAVQSGGAGGLRRRLLLAGAAISLAVAIWSMHFVGMLAARLPFPVDYLVFPTLLSFLVCVIVVGAAGFSASPGPPPGPRPAIPPPVMGGGRAGTPYSRTTPPSTAPVWTPRPASSSPASRGASPPGAGLSGWGGGGRGGRRCCCRRSHWASPSPGCITPPWRD